MTENKLQDHNHIICDCTGTTYQKVEQLIHDGSDTLDKISRKTGACSGCGACDILVIELIEEMKAYKAPES